MLGGLAWQVTSAEFMEQCAEVDKTKTCDGYNPLLEDYSNTKFYISLPSFWARQVMNDTKPNHYSCWGQVAGYGITGISVIDSDPHLFAMTEVSKPEVDRPYLVAFCCLLPYTTIFGFTRLKLPEMYQKMPGSIPESIGANLELLWFSKSTESEP